MLLSSRVAQFTYILLAVLTCTTPSRADVLYTNGPPNGTYDAWDIAGNDQIQNSFSLSSPSTLTAVTFGNWLLTGDSASSVGWAIVTSEGTQTLACAGCSGTATLTSDGTFAVSSTAYIAGTFIGINQEFSLADLSLSAGTYWLELDSEVVSNGDYGLWDMDDGPSLVWADGNALSPSDCQFAQHRGGCSDSFDIIGTSTPEPSSLALLGSGLTLLGVELRRRRLHHQRSE